MSYNEFSRARNLLKKASASIGQIQLDPAVYGSLVVNLAEVNEILDILVTILERHQEPMTAKLTDRKRWRRGSGQLPPPPGAKDARHRRNP